MSCSQEVDTLWQRTKILAATLEKPDLIKAEAKEFKREDLQCKLPHKTPSDLKLSEPKDPVSLEGESKFLS